jgi:hypothetical protein
MAILQWALICQRVLTDRDSNSVSYIEAVEQLVTPQFPFPFPPVYISTLWRRQEEGEPIDFRLLFMGPSNQELTRFSPGPTQETQFRRHRINVLFGGFTVQEPGQHVLVVEQLVDGSWRSEARLIVDVELRAPEQNRT